MNYGIDFTGGTVIEVDTGKQPTPADIEKIRGVMTGLNLGSTQLQTIKSGANAEREYIRISLPIQDESLEREAELTRSMIESMAALEGQNFVIDSYETNAKGFTTIMVSHGDDPFADEIKTSGSGDAENVGEPQPAVTNSELDQRLLDVETAIKGNGLDVAEFSRRGEQVEIRFQQPEEASATVQQLALGYAKLALAKEIGPYEVRSQDLSLIHI